MNQEQKIKKLIKEKGFQIQQIIAGLDCAKETFYSNIKRQPLTVEFKKEMLKKFKISLDEIEASGGNNKAEELAARIRELEKELKLKDELLDLMREKLNKK